MNCQGSITHAVRAGDTLYALARRYHTHWQTILALNPGLDPRSMQIGRVITICPGAPLQGAPVSSDALRQLSGDMRQAWAQHVMWTRMLILSMVDRLGDEDPVTARLLQNPALIAGIFARYYGQHSAGAIQALLTEHLAIGKELIGDLIRGDAQAAADANARWYRNADDMARAFAGLSPNYREAEMRAMLRHHLDLTKAEVSARMAHNYPQDIAAYDRVDAQAVQMADMFTDGIAKQFPLSF